MMDRTHRCRREPASTLWSVSAVFPVPRQKEAYVMLSWAVVFLVVALLAAVFGFSGIAGTASNIAWILFVVFLIIAVISFLSGRTRVL